MVTEFILLAFSNLENLQILLFIFVLLAFISCFAGNSAILILVRSESLLHTPMYFFISDFALLEIIFACVTIPKLLANLLGASRKISFTGCFAQLYAFNSFGIAECYLLAVMAFDRNLAINRPLHYSNIMNNALCTILAVSPWVIGFVLAAIPTTFTAKLEFCGPNEVNHFFCDLSPLQNIACSDPLVNISALVIIVVTVFASMLPFMIILGFYLHIIAIILKIKGIIDKQKAFSTCSSHLIVTCLFYGSVIVVYGKPKGSQQDKFFALIYTVVIPLVNPFIYTLRNKDVKAALRKSKLLRSLGLINGEFN
ncbi:olfactory receptor 6N1-like [Leptodactylus fuscus]|uniref:olfactory receptor 6N1-like n=1 Tax=Leptodactylus fuscus TaxID=238119 RepID=UPI003F4E7954